jgi:hypothetical protein
MRLECGHFLVAAHENMAIQIYLLGNRMSESSVQDSRILDIKTPQDMMEILLAKGRPLIQFAKGQTIHVWNKMRKGYSYELTEAPGTNLAFSPYATPGEILAAGAFEGKYLNDCLLEFPAEWFLNAITLGKLSPSSPSIEVNQFQILSRLPLQEWQTAGWVPSSKSGKNAKGRKILADASKNPDERGWFQWYCRYWMGRRLHELDAVQIARWKSFIRHSGAVKKNCGVGALSCRPRQRQALLQWAWNPYI